MCFSAYQNVYTTIFASQAWILFFGQKKKAWTLFFFFKKVELCLVEKEVELC